MHTSLKITLLLLLSSVHFCFAQHLQWNKVASGIWLAKAGDPDSLNFLTTSRAKPKITSINAMPDVPFPLSEGEIFYTLVDGKTYLRFPLEKLEKIFGLGLNFKTVEQRGRIMRLHVDHYGGRDDGRTHAPVPFYVSSKGYGVFINSPTYIDVWVGTAVRKDSRNPPQVRDRNTDKSWEANPYSDNIEILVPARGTEVYIFGGPSMLNVVQRYNLFNGGGCLPPRWGLGFWHRTPTLYSDKDVAAEVAEFKKRNFPLSVIGLEPGWQSKSYPCTYQWDNQRFPQPTKFVADMNQQGVQVNVWLNPFVSPESDLYRPILPFTASHTVWTGVVPDYSLPQATTLIASHFQKNLVDMGVSGYKMDENDGYDQWLWPDVTTFPSGHSAEQMRQLYGVMMQKMTVELYRKKNIRTYGLVRGSNAGATSFPYVIYNDYYSHPDFITALINIPSGTPNSSTTGSSLILWAAIKSTASISRLPRTAVLGDRDITPTIGSSNSISRWFSNSRAKSLSVKSPDRRPAASSSMIVPLRRPDCRRSTNTLRTLSVSLAIDNDRVAAFRPRPG